jgi:hypothetical protein
MSNTFHRGYTPWIKVYASDTYQAVFADDRATKDRLMAERRGPFNCRP